MKIGLPLILATLLLGCNDQQTTMPLDATVGDVNVHDAAAVSDAGDASVDALSDAGDHGDRNPLHDMDN